MTRTPVSALFNERVYLGIDPGMSGVIAALHDVERGRPSIVTLEVPVVTVTKRSGKDKRVYDLQALYDLLRPFRGLRAIAGLEALTGRPGLSSQSVFGMGRAFGLFEMALVAHAIPRAYVLPQIWKRALGVLGKKGQDEKSRKAESVLKAQELFPWIKFPLVRDHNKADAVLIAEFMRRTHPL